MLITVQYSNYLNMKYDDMSTMVISYIRYDDMSKMLYDEKLTSFLSRLAIRLEVVYTSSRVRVWYLSIKIEKLIFACICFDIYPLIIVFSTIIQFAAILMSGNYLRIPTFPRAFVN